MTILAIL